MKIYKCVKFMYITNTFLGLSVVVKKILCIFNRLLLLSLKYHKFNKMFQNVVYFFNVYAGEIWMNTKKFFYTIKI